MARAQPQPTKVHGYSCATAHPGAYCLIHIGETKSFLEGGIASHKMRWCWNGAGEYAQKNLPGASGLDPRPAGELCINDAPDGVPLYVSVLLVDSDEKRCAIKTELHGRLGPPCNGEFMRSLDSGYYVPARSQAYQPQLTFFVPGSP